MNESKVLATETIHGITSLLTKNDDGLVVHFVSEEARDAFVRWLQNLRGDAEQLSAERYERVRRQMILNPDVGE